MPETWHSCDGKIGASLYFVTVAADEWNDGRSSWALVIIADRERQYLPINFCPICGEELSDA